MILGIAMLRIPRMLRSTLMLVMLVSSLGASNIAPAWTATEAVQAIFGYDEISPEDRAHVRLLDAATFQKLSPYLSPTLQAEAQRYMETLDHFYTLVQKIEKLRGKHSGGVTELPEVTQLASKFGFPTDKLEKFVLDHSNLAGDPLTNRVQYPTRVKISSESLHGSETWIHVTDHYLDRTGGDQGFQHFLVKLSLIDASWRIVNIQSDRTFRGPITGIHDLGSFLKRITDSFYEEEE
jgi:hypothetical protein